MARGTIQLTIERTPEGGAVSPLSRHQVLNVKELPCLLLGEEVAPGGEGLPGRPGLFLLEEDSRGVRIVARAGGPAVCVNGKDVEGSARLSGGDRISCDGYEYGYYLLHEKVGLAFSSHFLSAFARGFAVVFIVLELLAMVALPMLFVRTSMWNSVVASQRINNKLDLLRRRAERLDVESVVARAIAGELSAELNRYARYIRQNGMQLRRSQRRRIQAELARMEGIMEHLESGQPIPADVVRKPSLDEAVRRIVGD